MGKKSEPHEFSTLDQLKKYAKDLSEVYESEKEKRKELELSHKQLVKYADAINNINAELKDRNAELSESYLDTIHRLVLAAEYKDQDTGDHIVRISRYSSLVAEKLGLPAKDVQNIYYATPMHDVGKIGIPDSILMKPGKLTDEEFEVIKTHSIIGGQILAGSKAEVLSMAELIAVSHHEKWNGRGYPHGLSRNKIPLAGRIVGLIDVFDALTSKRPYKEPYPVKVAYDIIKVDAGQHFDPEVTDVFLKNIKEIKKIKNEVDSMENIDLTNFSWSERDQQEKSKNV